MMRKYFLFICAVLLTAASHVYAAEEKKTPVEEFRYMTESQVKKCQSVSKGAFAMFNIGLMTSRTFSHQDTISMIGNCLIEGKAEIKKLFPRANSQIAKKSVASKLLKEYYAVWLAAFDGSLPDKAEFMIDPDGFLIMNAYDRRQNDASRKVTEAWYRFEVEANL